MLSKASAYTSSAMQLATILGPSLAGILYGWLGVSFPAGIACSLLVVAVVSTFLIRTPVPAPERTGKKPVAEELLSGLRFVFGHPILLPALTLDMLSVFFGGVTALLPIFAAEVLFTDSKGLGLLRAAPAIGAGIMSFALTRFDYREKAGPWLLGAVTGFGVCILVFGLSRSFWLSMGALALSGAFDSVSMIVRGTAVQFASPDAMRGRISSVNSIFIGSSNELGEFESGLAAHFFGTVPAVLFGGLMCLGTVAGVAIFAPSLRSLNLRKLEQEPSN
ncbi:MAG: MFS transporter [Proteobacteria bacterium]|nr:MAG: MFS transporter [Pseudomonadota bacterium]